jgi:hypothetical protein
MRRTLLVPCLLAWGLAGTAPLTGAEGKPAPFSLAYAHAGLTEITVKDGKLRYVWHTLRRRDGEVTPRRGNLDEYDRHQIDAWLTDKEAKRFRDWVARHKVFGFDKDYPSSSGGRARGAAFQSGLTIIQEDKKHTVSWVGDSKTPRELDTAINELTALASEIEKSRRK